MGKRKKTILLVIGAVLTAAALTLGIIMSNLSSSLESQKTVERWQGESETRFAQVSCFFPVGKELDAGTLQDFHSTIEDKIKEAGLEEPENGRLWTEGYSAKCTVNVSGSRGSSSAAAYAVGGDYFVFHPLKLKSGSYISGSDLMQDRVVLDEELAWKLFGGCDLAGMYVEIGGSRYLVAGVVEREDDSASVKAYNDGPGLYMSYDAALENEYISGISCYELVMANPMTGFAKTAVSEFMSSDGQFPVIENSSRFSIGSIFSVLRHFNERAIGADGVLYPYWENAARLTENKAALCLLGIIAACLFPVGGACVLLFIYLRRLGGYAKNKVIQKKDRAESRRYSRKTARPEKQEQMK